MVQVVSDFHNHSKASDGIYTPTELVSRLKAAGITIFALTDHDTVNGCAEAAAAAAAAGLDFIPGIEISADITSVPGFPELCREPQDLHILGLGIDHTCQAARDLQQRLTDLRLERNQYILDALAAELSPAPLTEALIRAHCTVPDTTIINRCHMSIYMQEVLGLTEEFVWDHLLAGENRCLPPASVGHISAQEAVQRIHDCGGVAVLAHPVHSLGRHSVPFYERFFAAVKKLGMDGIEASHPTSAVRPRHRRRVWRGRWLEPTFKNIAGRLHMLTTSGSDYHGLPSVDAGAVVGGASEAEAVLKAVTKYRN